MTLPRPCLVSTCGVLSAGSYCAEHRPTDLRRGRDRSSVGRGGDWIKLSKRARAIQPWCLDCGTRADLTADHLPAAWAAIHARRSVTLAMVEVVCRACNSARGPAEPGSSRYAQWLADGDTEQLEPGSRGVSPSQKGFRAPGLAPPAITHYLDAA